MEIQLTIKQAAEMMRVHPDTLRDWDRKGKFPAVLTPGGHRRYRMSDCLNFINNNKDIS